MTASAPDGGWQSLFFGASGPGAYTAFNITSDGSAPAAPDLLSIQNVDAYEYTFSNTAANPYSFSFLELTPLTGSGAFPIAPFQVAGLTFTQATLSQGAGRQCFQFGTAGATLTATPFTCGLTAFAPDGGWQSLFVGASGPGAYTAFNAASNGSAPAAPGVLTITTPPEPSTLALVLAGLALVRFLSHSSPRTCRFHPQRISQPRPYPQSEGAHHRGFLRQFFPGREMSHCGGPEPPEPVRRLAS